MFLKTKMPLYRTTMPTTPDEALIERYAYYRPAVKSCTKDSTTCPYGTCTTTSYFAVSKLPICFARDNALQAYYGAKSVGEPLSPVEAMAQNKDYFWSASCGKYCGHVGMKTFDGKCYICSKNQTKSPRQIALENGQNKYMPVKQCKNGHTALKRVDNGECSACAGARPNSTPPRQIPIYKLYPDMVVSYEMAVNTGMKTYRTGEKCKNGHAGWRWVSTRNCLTCMGRAK